MFRENEPLAGVYKVTEEATDMVGRCS